MAELFDCIIYTLKEPKDLQYSFQISRHQRWELGADELWKADFQDFPEVREGVLQTLIVNKHLFLQTIMINHDLPPICLHFMWLH